MKMFRFKVAGQTQPVVRTFVADGYDEVDALCRYEGITVAMAKQLLATTFSATEVILSEPDPYEDDNFKDGF